MSLYDCYKSILAQVRDDLIETTNINNLYKDYKENNDMLNKLNLELEKYKIKNEEYKNKIYIMNDKISKKTELYLTTLRSSQSTPIHGNIIYTDQFNDKYSSIFNVNENNIEFLAKAYTLFDKNKNIDEYFHSNDTIKLLIKFEFINKLVDSPHIAHFIKDDIINILKNDYNIIIDMNRVEILKQNDIYIISIYDQKIIAKMENISIFIDKIMKNDNYNTLIKIIDPMLNCTSYINIIDVKNLTSITNPNDCLSNLIMKSMYTSETLKPLNNNIKINHNVTLNVNSYNIIHIKYDCDDKDDIVKVKKLSENGEYLLFIERFKEKIEYNEEKIEKKSLFDIYKKYMLDSHSEIIKDNYYGQFIKKMIEFKLITTDNKKPTCVIKKDNKNENKIEVKNEVNIEIIDNKDYTRINNYIYIITDPSHKEKNEYKIGRHIGSRKDLEKRYITSIPQLEIVAFISCKNNKSLENHIKHHYNSYRILNINKNKSEFFTLDEDNLNKVKKSITNWINEYDQ
jgi:hypothetical protein